VQATTHTGLERAILGNYAIAKNYPDPCSLHSFSYKSVNHLPGARGFRNFTGFLIGYVTPCDSVDNALTLSTECKTTTAMTAGRMKPLRP
jgi:hypothetical protein